MTSQSELFEIIMRNIWDNRLLDLNDDDLYDSCNNAQDIASVMGGKLMGALVDEWQQWLFLDGSTIYVNISGSGITKSPQPQG